MHTFLSIILTSIIGGIGQSCPVPFQYFKAFNKYVYVHTKFN